jgi:Ca-activated chloride channel family protein
MARSLSWGLFGMVFAMGLAAPGVLAQQGFRARIDLVRLPVVVLGADGVPVTGLAAEDFEVREDGDLQTVVSFAAGARGAGVPLHLGLMLDKSESMAFDREHAADAAVSFVDMLEEVRDVTFVEFDAYIRIGRFTPANYLRLFERIRDPAMGPRTVLYDAIAHYLDTTLDRPGQHVMVLYTDGGDSGRGMSAGDVVRLLRFGNVLLYVIGYLDHQPQSDRIRQRAVLTQLARDTGGEAYFPATSREIGPIYERIRREIESRYTLGYVPGVAGAAGEFRPVEVRLRPSGLADAQVRTRAGYIAGASR